jgi:hypothetical protein
MQLRAANTGWLPPMSQRRFRSLIATNSCDCDHASELVLLMPLAVIITLESLVILPVLVVLVLLVLLTPNVD